MNCICRLNDIFVAESELNSLCWQIHVMDDGKCEKDLTAVSGKKQLFIHHFINWVGHKKKLLKCDIFKVCVEFLFINVNNAGMCARACSVSMFCCWMCMHEPLV